MRVFHEVMLAGSISQAARNLNRTQPAVSAAIASLEGELGLRLFERTRGRLHPVPEAHYLLEECRDLLRRADTLSRNMRRLRRIEAGELRIASMPGPSVFFLPDLLARYTRGRDDVRLTLASRSSDVVAQLLATQQYDLGIADASALDMRDDGPVTVESFAFRCVCAVPRDHELAKRDAVTTHDLDGRPMGMLGEPHDVPNRLAETFEAAGCALNRAVTAQYFLPLLTFVERGIACAVVDPLTVRGHRIAKGPSSNDADGPIAFRPFEPAIPFVLSVIRPNHRPGSVVAKDFHARLTDALIDCGGRPVG